MLRAEAASRCRDARRADPNLRVASEEGEARTRDAVSSMGVQAYGEAGDLLDRAIELYNHVPDAKELANADRAELLDRAARARYYEGLLPRSTALFAKAIELVDEEAEPRRAAVLYGWLERSLTHWGHADEGEEALAHALSLIPADDHSLERAWLITNRTKALMLRSRYADAVVAGREAMPLVRAIGDPDTHAGLLNALGVALMAVGEEDEGAAMLRAAARHELQQPRGVAAPRRPQRGGPRGRAGGPTAHRGRQPFPGLAEPAGRRDPARPRAPRRGRGAHAA